MYLAPANWFGPVGGVSTSPAEIRLPDLGSYFMMYLVKMLRSPSDVLVPPGLAKFPWIVELAVSVFSGRIRPADP